jgi:1-deoxy-D-xylulose-5-phosphate reductoisomerase
VLNAANEVAVAAFLEGRLSLPGIAAVVEKTLGDLGDHAVGSLGEVMAMDAEARRYAGDAVSSVH